MCDYSSVKFIIREGASGDILGGFWVCRRELKLVKLPAEDKLSKRHSSSPLASPAVDWLFSCKSSQPGLVGRACRHVKETGSLKGLWRMDGWKTNDPDTDQSPILCDVISEEEKRCSVLTVTCFSSFRCTIVGNVIASGCGLYPIYSE